MIHGTLNVHGLLHASVHSATELCPQPSSSDPSVGERTNQLHFVFYFWLALLLAKKRCCRVLGDRQTYGKYLGKIHGARSNTSPNEIIRPLLR